MVVFLVVGSILRILQKKTEDNPTRWLRPKAQHTAFAVLFATVPPFKRMVLLVRPWMPPPDCDRGVENKD